MRSWRRLRWRRPAGDRTQTERSIARHLAPAKRPLTAHREQASVTSPEYLLAVAGALDGARLSGSALAGLARQFAPGAEVVGSRPLAGGLSAETDEIELERDGERWLVVLRRHQALHQLGLARSEFTRLERLHEAGLPVPAPLLFDEGDLFGVPALVLQRLPGRPDVDPRDPAAWAETMGSTLGAIHAIDLEPFDDLPFGQPNLPDMWLPAVSQHPLGRQAWDLLREDPPASSPQVLLHGDFQSTNVLWDEGELTAVLDWTMVSRGDAGVDLGESRIDALLLFGPHLADEFLNAYQRTRGVAVADMAKWDLRGAMVLGMVVPLSSWAERYAALGRNDLSLEVLQKRLDAWITRSLEAIAIGNT